MRRVAALLGVLALGGAAPDTGGLGYDQRPGAALPMEAAFVDQAGRPTTLGQAFGGRPGMLQLGWFACPSLCGITRDDLSAALAGTGLPAGDYSLVFVSIDPAETPADAARAPAAPGGLLLTGSEAAIRAVADASGFRFRFDPALKQFLHPAGVVLVTADGRVSSTMAGVGFEAGALRAGLLRAGQGAVAAAASPILLLCFHFDPATGRYTLAIMKVLRLAAGLTVLTVLGMLAVLWRAERGRARP